MSSGRGEKGELEIEEGGMEREKREATIDSQGRSTITVRLFVARDGIGWNRQECVYD